MAQSCHNHGLILPKKLPKGHNDRGNSESVLRLSANHLLTLLDLLPMLYENFLFRYWQEKKDRLVFVGSNRLFQASLIFGVKRT
jgi:hypothetical protein